jgi:putative oxidoreductase
LAAKTVKTIASMGKTQVAPLALLPPVHLPRGRPSAPESGAATMNATRFLPFVGRLFIGMTFMASGLSKVANYAGKIALIESSKLPLPPPLAFADAISVKVGCGLFIILGYQTRIVAMVFSLFCVATAVFFHTNFADPNQTFHLL